MKCKFILPVLFICFFITQSASAQCSVCTLTNPAVLPNPIGPGVTVCITTDRTYDGGANLTGGSIHVCNGANVRINGAVDMTATSEITTTGCSIVEVHGNIENPNPIGLKVIDNCNCPNSITSTGPIFGFQVVCGPLPIELVSFNVALGKTNEVKIDWTTSSEINNHYFIVERSTDMMNWELTATVTGAGYSNELRTYNTTDILNSTGTYYYRLTQFDYDGKSEVFDVKSITCNSIQAATRVNIYPNPAKDFVTLYMNGNLDADTEVEIIDLSGKVMYSSMIAKGSAREQRLNLDGIGNGVYVVKINGGSLTQSSKLIIGK